MFLSIFLLGLVVYTYVIYPVVVFVLSRISGSRNVKAGKTELPSATILITGHNIGHLIPAKLKNISKIKYSGNLSVRFILDCCDDDSEDLIRAAAGNFKFPLNVTFTTERNGKEFAIGQALADITSEVLVFSDSDAFLEVDAVEILVEKLMEPGVGAVSGRELHVKEGESGASQGQGLFYRYEEFLKKNLERIGSLCYVQGGNFAMWRKLYPKNIPLGCTQDGIIAFDVVLSGNRVAYEEAAVSSESYNLTNEQDFARRVRTVSRSFFSVLSRLPVLNPFVAGWFSLHLLSARVLRWFTLPFGVIGFVTGLVLGDSWYRVVLIVVASVWCALFLLGWLSERSERRSKLGYFVYYFSYIHYAAAVATVSVLFGKRAVVWKPSS